MGAFSWWRHKSSHPTLRGHACYLQLVEWIIVAYPYLVSFEQYRKETYEFKPFLDNVLYILIVLSFFIPLYYSEFMLGFILGMTYTFGAILPTVFILVIAVIGLVTYRYIRPIILRLGNSLKKSPKS